MLLQVRWTKKEVLVALTLFVVLFFPSFSLGIALPRICLTRSEVLQKSGQLQRWEKWLGVALQMAGALFFSIMLSTYLLNP